LVEILFVILFVNILHTSPFDREELVIALILGHSVLVLILLTIKIILPFFELLLTVILRILGQIRVVNIILLHYPSLLHLRVKQISFVFQKVKDYVLSVAIANFKVSVLLVFKFTVWTQTYWLVLDLLLLSPS
jgi:hypothetical protein